MREYSGKNIFLGYIRNYDRRVIGRIGRVHKNTYYSMFMKVNDDSYFDLSNDYLYVGDESLQIKFVKKLNSSKIFSEKKLRKVLGIQLKSF